MKKLLLILLCFPIISFSQSYCSLLNVTDIDVDSLNMTIDIAVYDGNGGSPYPHAAYSIDAIGDTIHHGYLWLFANNGFDTTWYLYPINSFPTYPLSIYYVYGMDADTCVLSFNNNSLQNYGCTDALACNYDTLATIDDGSCTYPVIWYQTPLICDGDSIVVGISVYDTAGNYIDTLSSANGCDSLIHTYLMIDENTSSYDTLSVSASIIWNGSTLSVSGDYLATLINTVGCDSIANLNLTVTTTGISNITSNKSNLVKITDMLGQETTYRRNTPLFYIYDDGTVEKRLIIE